MVWYESMNSSRTTTLAMEQRRRQGPQKESTIKALTHRSGRTNQQATSNVKDNLALSFPNWWETGCNPPCISQEYACFQHLRKHHLAHRQQGPRQRDATTSWRTFSCQQTSKINAGLSIVFHEIMGTRRHPLVIEDEASMWVPMRIFLWSSRWLAYH